MTKFVESKASMAERPTKDPRSSYIDQVFQRTNILAHYHVQWPKMRADLVTIDHGHGIANMFSSIIIAYAYGLKDTRTPRRSRPTVYLNGEASKGAVEYPSTPPVGAFGVGIHQYPARF